ncbi:uncharacterized protein LOC144124311 [Amblyomma americanum]
MEPDTGVLWRQQHFPSAFRRNSYSISEEDLHVSTGLDQVPRVIVRMLTSLAMLLLSAVIVVCIHMYARSVKVGGEELVVPDYEGDRARKPDPRSLELTLGPPLTDTAAPHQVTTAPTSPEMHTTHPFPTTDSRESSATSRASLLRGDFEGIQSRSAAQIVAHPPSAGVHATASVKHGKWRPLNSATRVVALPTDAGKDDVACSAAHKSFCNTSGPTQFFYDSAERSCLASTAHKAHVCNHSPNQFASRKDCLAACVNSAPAPEPRCAEKPRFVACTSADARGAWWFHNGHKCTPWSFSGGRCPLASAPVFSTATECRAQCDDARTRVARGCLLPVSQFCEPRQLRRPYFAVPSAPAKGKRFECHKADSEFLARHRCLLGPNAFASWKECDATCRQRTRLRRSLNGGYPPANENN